MSIDRQMETLSAVYAEKSDGELLNLFEQRDGLTETARAALAGVMRERGLSAAVAETHEVESDVGGEGVAEGEGLVYLFHDAFEAREAMRHMNEAGVAFRMLDWHVVEPSMEKSYTGVDLGLVVAHRDAKSAVAVLQVAMGLLPEPEVAGGSDEGEFVVVSMFEREEALIAARALGAAGMTYLWRDGRDETAGLPDEETVAIEVQPENLKRAAALVGEDR